MVNSNGDWKKLILAILLATIPQAFIFATTFAVMGERVRRNTEDIRILQEKGSDPVQSMASDMKWIKEAVQKIERKLDQHVTGKPISMVTP
jgi:hypothetical protein